MDTPTETAVGNDRKYFTRLSDDPMGEGTDIVLDQCPQYTSILSDNAGSEYTGGNSAIGSCFLRRQGECVDDVTSNYCNSGGDFICPTGFKFVETDNTFNDCLACGEGHYCTGGSETDCADGYNCPEYTIDPNSYPAQPGSIVTHSDPTFNIEAACSQNNYCPGATGTESACPSGFNTVFGGTTDTENFSALACQPDDAGTSCSGG